MALNEKQQIFEAIKRAKSPLVIIPAGSGVDGYASAIGFGQAITKLDKTVEIVAAEGPTPKQLRFLIGHDLIQPSLDGIETLTLKLNVAKTQVDKLTYNVEGDELHIHLTPRSGVWHDNDLRTERSSYRHDLIISIGAQDLNAHRHLFEKHKNFFFNVPIINIDHSPANEHFGQYNLIDTTATACGEVCHNFICENEPHLMDEEMATCFLTAMISKTKSFKTSNVTPRTLQIASNLMGLGARRDQIVENLFRTRSVETLRLWGRALARLKSDRNCGLVWTLLSQQDFMQSGAEESDLPDVVDEMLASSPEAKVSILLYEDTDRNVCGIIRTEQPHDAVALAAPFKPAGTREEARVCFIGRNIVAVEKELVPKIQKALAL
ncbi:MAG: hypothetical protein ABIH67_03070 [Candidatus Uhrbacteria bacterium]